jgi:outer membrane lipoprotein-sorting protein
MRSLMTLFLTFSILVFSVLNLAFLDSLGFSQTLSGKEILNRVEKNLNFDSGYIEMEILDYKDNKFNRSFVVDVLFDLNSGTLMEFKSPPREKGKKILLIKDSMWMYVPGVSRPVRLSAKDNFMGTSIENKELLDYKMSDDYEFEVISNDTSSYVLELKANTASVPYPRVILAVDKSTFLPTRMEFYTLSGKLIKYMIFSDVKEIGGKMRPTVYEMRDVLTEGNFTKIVFNKLESRKVPSRIFSLENLTK